MAGIQGDETESVSNEFVSENRSVDFDFNKIDSHGWDFSEDGSAERVREGEVYVTKGEVDVVGGGLKLRSALKGIYPSRTVYLAHGDSRSHLINVHIVVIHDDDCATAQARSRPS